MVTKTFIVDDHYMVIEGIRSLLQNEKNIEYSILSKDLLNALFKNKLMQSPILVSSLTMSGMVNLTAALSRVLNLGEEKGE